eukprot:6444163-Amphidinium_carterae.1
MGAQTGLVVKHTIKHGVMKTFSISIMLINCAYGNGNRVSAIFFALSRLTKPHVVTPRTHWNPPKNTGKVDWPNTLVFPFLFGVRGVLGGSRGFQGVMSLAKVSGRLVTEWVVEF